MKPDPLAYVEIKSPNLYLRFTATHERITRVLEVVLKEAKEAEEELKASSLAIPIQVVKTDQNAP